MALADRAPGLLLRLVLRFPVWLYRLRLGWLLGRRFLQLEHMGRKSGKRRRTVLEVVGHDERSGVFYVVAAWGERSQWYRNVRAHPVVSVTVGRGRFEARADQLAVEDAERVLDHYAREHRWAMRELPRLLGSDDVRELSRKMPVLALVPSLAG